MSGCLWCLDDNGLYPADELTDPDAQLCRSHLAEHEGLTEAELDRMDAEQALDLI